MSKLSNEEFQAYLKQIRELAEGPLEEIQKEVEVTNKFPQEFFRRRRWFRNFLVPDSGYGRHLRTTGAGNRAGNENSQMADTEAGS
ncbi:hypothetical protein QMP26_12900 [Enterocloster clostridioformis]|uniref:hypothetical protein n=1 Tax=Enterocloster clostridioformis TaxID=1531 RepID=UPI0026772201|nr:hypothetical protein [Enterocloster clostridioformis]